MRIDPDTCRDHALLAAEVRRLRAVIAEGVAEWRESLEAEKQASARVAELEQAIRRLAEQDATLSVCDGNVTVTIDAALTDAERKALRCAAATCRGVGHAVRSWPENQWADTIDALLERHAKGGEA